MPDIGLASYSIIPLHKQPLELWLAARLQIRITLMRIRDHIFIKMRFWIQLSLKCRSGSKSLSSLKRCESAYTGLQTWEGSNWSLRAFNVSIHGHPLFHFEPLKLLKGTQDWAFFWLRIWILYHFIVSSAKILRICKKKYFDWAMNGGETIGPLSLRLRGNELSLVSD